MPSFLHYFKKELEEKQARLGEILERGTSNILDDDFKNKLETHWRELPVGEKRIEDMAVDSSRAVRNYANGSSMYIVRAMALGRGERTSKFLQANAFVSPGTKQTIRGFVRLKSEHTEHKVAIKELNKHDYDVLLLDGSLFGRLMHLPSDQPVKSDFLLEYKETLTKLIKKCRREQTLLLGVSKDSSASFLRDMFLDEFFQEEITQVQDTLSKKLQKKIVEQWEEIQQHPFQVMEEVKKLRGKYGETLDRITQLFKEHLSSRVDFSLIGRFCKIPGYTTPIELGPSTLNFQSAYKRMREQPNAYLEDRFRRSLALADDPEAFKSRGRTILDQMCQLPTVLSFHVLLDSRDSPLRVDTPTYEINRDEITTLAEFDKTKYNKKNMERVKEIIRILKSGYAGLNTYNVLLKQVDRRVKLKKREVDNIYENILRDFFDLPLIHTRRYRRVRPF